MKKLILVLFFLPVNFLVAQEIRCQDVLNVLIDYKNELTDSNAKEVAMYGLQRVQQLCQQHQQQQQQQQQRIQQQQQHHNNSIYLAMYSDQIYDTGYRILLFCEGEQNRELVDKIKIGYCLDQHRRAYQQSQHYPRCDYRSQYLRLGESFVLGNTTYYCRR